MELKIENFNICLTSFMFPILSPEWFLILLFRFLNIINDIKIIIPNWFLRLCILETFSFLPPLSHSFRMYRAELAKNTPRAMFNGYMAFLKDKSKLYRFCFSKSLCLNVITGVTIFSTLPSNPQAALMWELLAYN